MEAIGSVYKQTYDNWEIIIVDDFSNDDSKEIYTSLSNDNRIKIYFNKENRGCGYTKRRCAELASGEICGFLDPDDALTDDALEVMINSHIKNPKVSMIHSKFFYCDKDLKIESIYQAAKDITPKDSYFFNLEGNISHFVSFKKEFYNKTEGIDPFQKKAVDQDMYIKLYEVGDTIFIDKPLYYYRNHDGSISLNKNAEKAYFWHWVAVINGAKRRSIDIESFYFGRCAFIQSIKFYSTKYRSLKKYENLNSFLSSIRRILHI